MHKKINDISLLLLVFLSAYVDFLLTRIHLADKNINSITKSNFIYTLYNKNIVPIPLAYRIAFEKKNIHMGCYFIAMPRSNGSARLIHVYTLLQLFSVINFIL